MSEPVDLDPALDPALDAHADPTAEFHVDELVDWCRRLELSAQRLLETPQAPEDHDGADLLAIGLLQPSLDRLPGAVLERLLRRLDRPGIDDHEQWPELREATGRLVVSLTSAHAVMAGARVRPEGDPDAEERRVAEELLDGLADASAQAVWLVERIAELPENALLDELDEWWREIGERTASANAELRDHIPA